MTNTLTIVGSSIFAILGLWHFYWALGGSVAKATAIPEIDGAPAFSPSNTATAFVGVALLSFVNRRYFTPDARFNSVKRDICTLPNSVMRVRMRSVGKISTAYFGGFGKCAGTRYLPPHGLIR